MQIMKMTDYSDVEYEAKELMKMILAFTSLLASHNRYYAKEMLSTIMGKFSTLIRVTGEKYHKIQCEKYEKTQETTQESP